MVLSSREKKSAAEKIIPQRKMRAASTQSKRNSDVYRSMLCKRYHSIRVCPRFIKMQPVERCRTVRQLKYCVNCLAKSHTVAYCKSKNKCRNCHHTMLHPSEPKLYTTGKPTKAKTKLTNRGKLQNCQHTQNPANRAQGTKRKIRGNLKKAPNQLATSQPLINQHIISDAIRSLATVLCASHQSSQFQARCHV
ncbi:uncharacterized protein LOC142234138 [Haematobia irritans]|uniref:uncharacterized protein LOC142234138 n=1 Tax=Haematobia irritans TaxID=7368 RepID=UPI003F4FA98E